MTSFAYTPAINLNSGTILIPSILTVTSLFLGLSRICTTSYLVVFSTDGGGSRMRSTLAMVGRTLAWVASLN